MKKPTSALNFQILQFLFSDERLVQKLEARDQHQHAAGIELSCKFMRRDEDDRAASHYMVLFIYKTKNNFREDTDDLRVFVSVKDGDPVQIEITDVKPF